MSGISGVGYGNYYVAPKFCGEEKKKESHAVRNGALIGTGVGAVGDIFFAYKVANGFGFKFSEACRAVGYGKVAAGLVITSAITGLIGAGIGAIVKACSGSTEKMIGK